MEIEAVVSTIIGQVTIPIWFGTNYSMSMLLIIEDLIRLIGDIPDSTASCQENFKLVLQKGRALERKKADRNIKQ